MHSCEEHINSCERKANLWREDQLECRFVGRQRGQVVVEPDGENREQHANEFATEYPADAGSSAAQPN